MTATHEQNHSALYEVRLLHGLRLPMRDGVRLSADVYSIKIAEPASGG